MGHGIPAALKAVTINYLLKPSASGGYSVKNKPGDKSHLLKPSATLEMLNDHFVDDRQGGSFFTIFYGILNTENFTLTFTRAGHCPPVLIPANGAISELRQGGPAVGLAKDVKYQDYVIHLKAGDKLFFYTDGITEAKNSEQKPFSKKGLLELLSNNKQMAISQLTGSVVYHVAHHLGSSEAEDDLTLFGLELLGKRD